MRLRWFKIITTSLFILAGIATVFLAIFAYQLGLDNNAVMGVQRKLLVGAGILLIVFVPTVRLLFDGLQKLDHHQALTKFKNRIFQPILKYFLHSKSIQNSNTSRRATYLWCAAGVLIVILIAVFFITGGKMVSLEPHSHYFDMQADGFLAGQTSLLLDPPDELTFLPDPYDWKSREGFRYLWDASYFEGNYYLYWGPVPALFAVVIKMIHPGLVEDQFLLILFFSGLVLVFFAFLKYLRDTYFPSVSGWFLALLIFIFGLSNPIFWLINRPSVYETAIAACQFFLLLGLYAAVRGLNSSTHPSAWFLLSGAALGASVGSRTSIFFTVLFIFGVTILTLVSSLKTTRKRWVSILYFSVPLGLFALGLAWFNFIRFGNPLETGLRYQLTGDVLPEDLQNLFSLWYLAPNVYYSLFQPFLWNPGQFPFIFPTINYWITNWVKLPNDHYQVEVITGIFCALPVLWLFLFPLMRLIHKFRVWLSEKPRIENPSLASKPPGWLWFMVAGGAFIAWLTTSLFVMITMRYLVDFLPLLILLFSISIMAILESSKDKPRIRIPLHFLVFTLGTATILIGVLINFANPEQRFAAINPELYLQISGWFN